MNQDHNHSESRRNGKSDNNGRGVDRTRVNLVRWILRIISARGRDLFSALGSAHLESGGADADGRQGGDGSDGGSRRDGRRTESQVDTSLALGNRIPGLNLERDRLTGSLSAFAKRYDSRFHGWTLFPNTYKSDPSKNVFQTRMQWKKEKKTFLLWLRQENVVVVVVFFILVVEESTAFLVSA